eukprot:6545753-Heterocapsa_arctica.AAC.1
MARRVACVRHVWRRAHGGGLVVVAPARSRTLVSFPTVRGGQVPRVRGTLASWWWAAAHERVEPVAGESE